MDKKPLSPTNDFVFHKIFGENMKTLIGFLQAVLDLPFEEYRGPGLPHYMRAVFEKNDFNLMGMIFDSKKQLLT